VSDAANGAWKGNVYWMELGTPLGNVVIVEGLLVL